MMSSDPSVTMQGWGDPHAPQYGERGGPIDPELVAFFAQYGTPLSVGADSTLLIQHGNGFRLSVVRSGLLLEAVKLPRNRRRVLCFYCPGDLMFTRRIGQSPSTHYRSVGSAELVRLDDDAFGRAQEEAPEMLAALLCQAMERIVNAMLHGAAIGRLNSEERLATFLLELALRTGRAAGEAVTFDFQMRREDVADYLTMNPDTLSRSMSKLKREGVLTSLPRGQVIVQRQALCARTPLAATMIKQFGPVREVPPPEGRQQR